MLIIPNATVYLKTQGIDPKTHPVVPELVSNILHVWRVLFLIYVTLPNLQDRIREYFEKINVAENPPASTHKATLSIFNPFKHIHVFFPILSFHQNAQK